MPSYTNSNATTVYSGEPYVRLEPGVTITDKDLKSLPTGVTLSDHEPYLNPWILLATVSSYPSASIDVAPYDNVIIDNETNGVISVEANGVTANALRLQQYTQSFMDNTNRKTGSIKILSTAGTTGNVYVYSND